MDGGMDGPKNSQQNIVNWWFFTMINVIHFREMSQRKLISHGVLWKEKNRQSFKSSIDRLLLVHSFDGQLKTNMSYMLQDRGAY